jgi:hypothetical protein
MSSANEKKERFPVVVTTEHRGVFFGYTEDPMSDPMKLYDARNCVYWSADVKGWLGLAVGGPTSGCRIGPKVKGFILKDITSVAEVGEAAVAAWEAAPWSK